MREKSVSTITMCLKENLLFMIFKKVIENIYSQCWH